ncbi:MAG: LptF/LptG family permease [Prevotella sp.]|jgi:lipopolysaccharide export system permease protein|uniref:Membrane protein n=2 Tax=Xylanibacter ruminicola TaxID=839 RepID=D5EU89_XYLR2|nr:MULTISPECIES: LptF/LptG family permease [Prevotellaceae]MBP3248099.1 LptF/LptG family permease [Prevotella sp.]ADE83164.1 putative membrane protein [Xylanibacter ruminicola 23]MBQ4413950.1 LptF/LptG family permease [Prevotella sp.]MBR0389334.1 LptF/LptG family permease [Prevotella sp.]MDO4986081.1 LptF/LptG family permease [Prevotella sp.]
MFRIKKLDIFIAKQFGLLFVGTFFICQFVLMMQFLWRYVDELIGKGLSLEVMAQFFWYMGLMLMPQAFPLAILLSSLIAFGNLGESSELTAIKAAGISLMQAFRSLIIISVLMAGISFYFQNVVGPRANQDFYRLLLGMKQKSPELEIPEGVFYDGIPGSNIYVQKKDLNTGMLYGIMIYRMTGSYEDQAIILADSGMMQSTAEKKHLLLTLYNGVWNENMRSQDLAGTADVPYRRETFVTKRIVLDFDNNFSMADINDIAGDARAKSLGKIMHDKDSLQEFNDSVGRSYYIDGKRFYFRTNEVSASDSVKISKLVAENNESLDSMFTKLNDGKKKSVLQTALNSAQSCATDLEMKGAYANSLHRYFRTHQIQAILKFTLALTCIIFFFIGAPLGAIIRKGGLGVPVIISVLVFIVYYILDSTGQKMARDDQWTVWYGMTISTVVLAPIACFFTYKANNDSVVFNIDMYKQVFMRILGLRTHRHIYRKEVIIEDPIYALDSYHLLQISEQIKQYSEEHKLLHLPNPIHVFFRPGDDQTIEKIVGQLEDVIDDLANTKDAQILGYLNHYPVVATHAHTRPFRRKWLNIISGLILPLGIFFYCRMCRFRLRLRKDLNRILETNQWVLERVAVYAAPAPKTMEDLENMPFIAELVRDSETRKHKD